MFCKYHHKLVFLWFEYAILVKEDKTKMFNREKKTKTFKDLYFFFF